MINITVGTEDVEYILVAFQDPIYVLFIRVKDTICISFYNELKKESISENFVFLTSGKCLFYF